MSAYQPDMPVAEFARRMTRSRTWHLYQAGAARRRAETAADEAQHCDELIRMRAVSGGPAAGGGSAA